MSFDVQPVSSGAPAPVFAATDVEIVEATSKADRNAFIRFQYEIYKNEPAFVPPLLMEREENLDPKKNPWFQFGTCALFLAKRNGKIVGRIAAVDDPRYNEFNDTKIGWFGFFECINDAGVAKALLERAESWVRARGHTEILGPASFSSNSEWAFLADSFDQEPALMMPYNPKYYLSLMEQCGYAKVKDLWAWKLDTRKDPPEKIVRIADKIRQREGIVMRPANIKDWDNEVRRIKDIYNSAWEKNWGFVPMTDAEFDALGKVLKIVLKPELVLFAEVKGEAVAFCITVPDANQAIKKANGRLFPFGLVKMLLAMRKIKQGRLIALGIKKEFRKRGLDSLMVLETFMASKRLGWWGGEVSWTLEDNDMVNRAIQVFGAERSKTYRVFGRPLVAKN